MGINSNELTSPENYKTQPAEFIIPKEKYNKMLYEILWVTKITKPDILSLLSVQDSIKKKINDICSQNWFTRDDLLERSRVWIRKEKSNENRLLLRNWKKKLSNIDNKSDEEIIELMKKALGNIIKLYTSDIIIYWPDGSINYALTMENIEEYDQNKKAFAEAVVDAKKKNKIRWKIIANTLSDSDFMLLDDVLFDALINSNKLSQWKSSHSIETFLRGKFPEIPKLFSDKAQKYFAQKYYPLYEEKHVDKSKELYPHDRKIVILPLSKSGKKFCKVRGEKEIIALTAKKIDEWKIDILSFVDTHVNQQKVEMLIQELINIYYEILHNINIYNYNEKNIRRLVDLDLETISYEYRERKGKDLILLEIEEFKKKLLEQAQSNIDLEKRKNTRTADLSKYDYDNIPKFEWFLSILEFYKEYFISSLNTKDPSERSRKPGRREILEKFGFNVIDKDKIPNKNKITIVTNNKKAS